MFLRSRPVWRPVFGFGLYLHVMSSLGSAKVAKSDLEELLLCSSEDEQFASDGVCVHGA